MPVCLMGAVPLLAAAWADWRTREIPDACVFLLKDKMKSLASSIAELEGKIPDTFKEDGRD